MKQTYRDLLHWIEASGSSLGLYFATLAQAMSLAVLALVGTSMRLSGDDYCYAAAQVRWGPIAMVPGTYLTETTFSGNRYTLTLTSELAGLFPPGFNGLLPGIVLVIWVTGMVFLAKRISETGTTPVTWAEAVFLAVTVGFLTLYQAPDLAQSLYWRTGMLTYTLPLVLWPLLGTAILWAGSTPGPGWRIAVPCLVAFLAAGSSEAGAMLQFTLLSLSWAAIVGSRRGQPETPLAVRRALLAGIAATGLALLVLVVSPSNAPRFATRPMSWRIDVAFVEAFQNAVSFIRETFEGLPVPTAATVVVGFAFALWIGLRRQPGRQEPLPYATGRLAALVAGALILITSMMIPSAYAQGTEPEMRAQILARWVIVVALLGVGFLGGRWALSRLQDVGLRASRIAAVSVLLLFGVYSLRAVPRFLSPRPFYVRWAQFWDVRDERIRTLRGQGERDIEVVEIDHPIPRVGELSPDPGYWYNNCAEEYYGVRSIQASLPGWNP